MNPITSLRAPQFSNLTPAARQAITRLKPGADSVLFGHGDHGHVHGPDCSHGHHKTTDHAKETTTQGSTHTHADGATCSGNHDHSHHQKPKVDPAVAEPAVGWFSKTYSATKTWFKNFYETLKDDTTQLFSRKTYSDITTKFKNVYGTLKNHIKALFSRKAKPDTKKS